MFRTPLEHECILELVDRWTSCEGLRYQKVIAIASSSGKTKSNNIYGLLVVGGKPIIALPSVTHRGESRIVSLLKPGAGVVTTRAHVHWICTEYGMVDLFGKSLKDRAKLLISVAHPDHRATLEKAARERFGI